MRARRDSYEFRPSVRADNNLEGHRSQRRKFPPDGTKRVDNYDFRSVRFLSRLCYPPVECTPTMFHQPRVLTTNDALVAISPENGANLSSAGIGPSQTRSALLSPSRTGFVLERPSSVSLGTKASFHGSHSSHHSHSSHCSSR